MDRIIVHPLIEEKGIQLSKVKLSELSAIHILDDLNHALLWIEQKDYPQVLMFADQKKISLGFLPIDGDLPSQFFKNLDLPNKFDTCLSGW